MHSRNNENNQTIRVRRKWLAVRFGLEVLRDVSDRNVKNLLFCFRKMLSGMIVVDETPERIMFTSDVSEVFYFLDSFFQEVDSSKELFPLILLIDDAENSPTAIQDIIARRFLDLAYIFKIKGSEARHIMRTNDFSEFRMWCQEFVQTVMIDNVESSQWETEANQVHREVSHVNDRDEKFREDSRRRDEGVDVQNVLEVLEAYDEDDHDHFVQCIAVDKFLWRIQSMFDNFVDNSHLLALIRVLLTPSMEISSRTVASLEQITMKLLNFEFLQRMCDQIYEELSKDANVRLLWSSIEDVVKVFLAIKYAHHNMDNMIQSQWDIFMQLVNHIPKWFWNEIPENLVNRLRNKVDEFTDNEKRQRHSEPERIAHKQIVPLNDVKPSEDFDYPSTSKRKSVNFWDICEQTEPPCDFKIISEVPQKKDILSEDPPYVRRALIGEKYDNAQHYLDVMFRLLREDLISPLRDGIHLFNTTGLTKSTDRNACSLKIYEVSEIRGLQVKFNDGIEFRYLVLTQQSAFLPKSLLFGQIICMSSDNFEKETHLGIIVERKEEMGSVLTIGVHFYTPFHVNESGSYVLVEPSSYFEAYQHVLKAIKNINSFRSFPMERYLVQSKTNVFKPLYMRLDNDSSHELDEDILKYYEDLRIIESKKLANEVAPAAKAKQRFNSHPIFPNRIKTANEDLRSQIIIYGETYNVDQLENEFVTDRLNVSQRKALIGALTNEICLIQGPPGTGKTFIGVEIVKTIIANRMRFGILKPVLLVCYTNAALDQFLEKVYKMLFDDMEAGILHHDGPIAVRLGSKSESELVEKMRLSRNSVVTDYRYQFAENESAKLGRAMRDRRNQAKELSMTSSILRLYKTKIMRYEIVRPVMSTAHSNEFTKFHREVCPKLLVDEAFGYWILDKPIVDVRTIANDAFCDNQDFETKVEWEEATEGDISLDELFRRMNVKSMAEELTDKEETLEHSEYETSLIWDLADQATICDNAVSLFGKTSPNGYDTLEYNHQIVSAVFDSEPQILKTPPLTQSESSNIDSILTITKTRRWELYNYWIESLRSKLLSSLPAVVLKYQEVCKEVQNTQQIMDIAVLKNSLIIGATTTGAAKFNDLLTKIGSKVVMIEESAEVLEGHCFASIPNTTEHLILIGDHQQLRPNPSVYELGTFYNLNISMFERLIKNNLPHICLTMQHRMLPLLTSTLISPIFYPNLEDHPCVKEYPQVAGMDRSMFFWSHRTDENSLHTSYSNPHEANMIAELTRYLLLQECYSPSDISVITPYSEQQALLKAKLDNLPRRMGFAEKTIAVETVDSFQGKENKIILLSLVRSNGDGIGFLSIINRVCVALTRAQHGFYVVGNMHFLKAKSKLWENIIRNLMDEDLVNFFIPLKCLMHGYVTEIYEPEDFQLLAADGGCREKCGASLGCGHSCMRRCHVGLDHLQGDVCNQPCLRTCSNEIFKHNCQNKCSQECGGCYQLEYVDLDCGHKAGGACQDLEKLKCGERCPKFLECGHQCSSRCGEECASECLELLPYKQECNHIAEYLCSNPEVGKCSFPCDKILACGHKCFNDCSDPCALECLLPVPRRLRCDHDVEVPCSYNVDSYPCPVMVKHYLEGCGHTMTSACSTKPETLCCSVRCFKPLECGHVCNRQCGTCREDGSHSCGEICRKKLPCGHQCMDRCGTACGPCKADCLTSCSHQACGSPSILTKTGISNGRQCFEICVLCNRICDNHCEHRSCQLRCFQVCDVKPCESPCMKKLPCGHVCLGMCSEVCPIVCGCCNQKKYREIIEILKETDSKPRVHRLISIPICNHVFPVSYLDDIMSDFKKKMIYPRCPESGCDRAIIGVQRYSRILKEITYKRYQIAERRRRTENTTLKNYNFEKYKSEVKLYFKRVDCLSVNSKIGKKLVNSLGKLRERWMGSSPPDFLYELSRSLQSLVYIVDLYFHVESDIPKKLSACGPNIERICGYLSSNGCIKSSTEKMLGFACDWFHTNMASEIIGVFVPGAREILLRTSIYIIVCKLCATNFKNCTDVEESKTTRLSTFLTRVNDTGSNYHIEDLLKKISACIVDSKMIPEKDMYIWKPFLNIPFPEY